MPHSTGNPHVSPQTPPNPYIYPNMDFEKLPIDQLLSEIKNQPDPKQAFENILAFAQNALPSKIWGSFSKMDLQADITDTTDWLQKTINQFPGSKGIYLGLDTLNMDEGNGTNIEIGLSTDCDPGELTDEWTYECENYGEPYLLNGLYLVSDGFENEELWSDDEREFAEYVIFLSYSGVVLREALFNLKTVDDFISIWGFHDGDMFFLVNKLNDKKAVITDAGL